MDSPSFSRIELVGVSPPVVARLMPALAKLANSMSVVTTSLAEVRNGTMMAPGTVVVLPDETAEGSGIALLATLRGQGVEAPAILLGSEQLSELPDDPSLRPVELVPTEEFTDRHLREVLASFGATVGPQNGAEPATRSSAELSEAQSALRRAQERVQELEEILELRDAELEEARRNEAELLHQGGVEEAEQSAAGRVGAITAVQERLALVKEKERELTEQVSAEAEQRRQAEQRLEEARGQVADLEKQVAASEQALAVLQQKLGDADGHEQAHRAELESLEAKLREAEERAAKERQEFQERLESAAKADMGSAGPQVALLEEKLLRQREELELAARLAEERLRGVDLERTDLDRQLREAADELGDRVALTARLEESLAAAERRHDNESQLAEKKLNEALEEIRSGESRVQQLEGELRALEERRDQEKQEHGDQLKQHEAKLAEIEQAREQVTNELGQVKRSLEEKNEAVSALQRDFEEQQQQYKAREAELQEAVDSARERVRQGEMLQGERAKEADELMSRLRKAEAELADVRSGQQDASGQAARLQQQLTEKAEEAQRLRTQLESLESEAAAAKELESSLRGAREELATLQQQNLELKAQADSAGAGASPEVEQLRQQAAQSQELVLQAAEQIKQLQSDLDARDRAWSEVKELVQKSQDEKSALENEVARLKQELAEGQQSPEKQRRLEEFEVMKAKSSEENQGDFAVKELRMELDEWDA